MNKHYDEAQKIMEFPGGGESIQDVTIDANTHATLALAYEQRTANLIALFDRTQYVAAFYGDHDKIAAEVRERLGLE